MYHVAGKYQGWRLPMRVAALAWAARLGYTEPDRVFCGRKQLCATSYRNHTGVKDMPKKSTTARQAHAARRSPTTARPSQTAARSQNVSLVRAPNAESPATDAASETPETPVTPATPAAPATSAADNVVTSSRPATPAKSTAGAARTTTATRPTAKATPKSAASTATATAAKPAPKAAAQPQGAHAAREQERRIARAKEMRRIRNANVVTPEHYRYVIHDLRMTAILAFAMFAVIIILHFVLA